MVSVPNILSGTILKHIRNNINTVMYTVSVSVIKSGPQNKVLEGRNLTRIKFHKVSELLPDRKARRVYMEQLWFAISCVTGLQTLPSTSRWRQAVMSNANCESA